MELLDAHTGRGRGVGDVTYETFKLEHTRQSVLRPHGRREAAAVGPDEDELDLMADLGVDAGVGEAGFDPAESATAAGGHRRAVLLEERAWCPSQAVAQRAQRGEVDSDPLIADHADALGERDAGLVDRESVPDRAGAEAGVGECARPAQRNGLGVGEARRVDDGADHRFDPAGLEAGDGGRGRGCLCHSSHSAMRARRPPRIPCER